MVSSKKVLLAPDESKKNRAAPEALLEETLPGRRKAALRRGSPAASDHSDWGESLELANLLDATEGDRGLVVELIGEFLASYRDRMAEMASASRAGNAQGLEKSAHRLKGSLGLFCQEEPLQLTERLIAMGEGNNLTEVPWTVELLQLELEQLEVRLRAFARRCRAK